MATQDLIDDIKTQLSEGKDSEVIKTELRTRGIPIDDIDSAFIAVGSGAPGEESSDWQISKKEVFIGIATILILAACVYLVTSYDQISGVISGISK